jgi:hypothetical protein
MSLHTTYLGGKSIFASIYNKIHFFLYGILFRNLNYIINSSNALTAGFKQHGVPSNKLKTIYNGVNNQRFKPVSETEKLALQKKTQFTGNRKNHFVCWIKSRAKRYSGFNGKLEIVL